MFVYQNTFFLLDEMFKGTNSEDRHKGGFSLINQISALNTSGIVATHDIELARLLEKKRWLQTIVLIVKLKTIQCFSVINFTRVFAMTLMQVSL